MAAKKMIDWDAQRRALVDEYAKLEIELLPHRPRQRRLEELAKLIRSWHVAAPPEATLSCPGNVYEVVLGPAGMQSHILSLAEVYRLLGRAKFLAAATVSLKNLEKSLDPATAATLIEKRRTGPRALMARAQ